MIFVTVSTGPFDRLIKSVDMLAPSLNEEVVMQIGGTTYEPKNYRYFRLCSRKEIVDYYQKADLIITHVGCGALAMALRLNKKCIAVPRYKKFDEFADDHQLDLVRELEKQNKVLAVYDIKDLTKAMEKSEKFKLTFSKDNSLVEYIKELISKGD